MRRRIRISMVSILCLLLLSSWGFLMHRTITQLAIYQLPKAMQPFFFENKDYLVKYSVRPDDRRTTDPAEASKHFIDLEAFGDSAAWKMPLQWDDAVKRYTSDSLVKYGYVPYWIIEMKEKLTSAFRSKNPDSILFYATDMAHYIEDAHVPLHTSINYDGQLTGQKGLHSLWESMVPEAELNLYTLSSEHKAEYISDAPAVIWQSIRNTHLLLPAVFNEEKEVSKAFTEATKYVTNERNGRTFRSYSPAFIKEYGKRLQPSVNEQAIQSSTMVADFWYTAWVDAGKPDIKHLLKDKFRCKDKRKMKKEGRLYRDNKLLENNLLLARQLKPGEITGQ
jgi:hypothetical protein